MARARMATWYDPQQLLRTGVDVILSTVFASRADFRQVEALQGRQDVFEYSDKVDAAGDFWLDYVADTGDGFNSTYAVAYAVSREKLEVLDARGQPLGRPLD